MLRQPVGVSVLVTPWNFPAAMATRKIGPALAAGCTVVLKPAKETPLTALAVAAILRRGRRARRRGQRAVRLVSPGPMVSAMLADPRVRKLSFTGSTEVGRVLLATAAETVTNCSMELGGNAPFIVFEDADIEAAMDGALIAKMRNGGEACTAANRFYVHDAVADEFTSEVRGPAGEDDRRPGPGRGHRPRAAGERGHPLQGGRAGGRGRRPAAARWSPAAARRTAAATTTCPPSWATSRRTPAILGTEIFGPVAPVVRFTDEAEAIGLANDTEFGLVSYLYSGDLRRALRVSRGAGGRHGRHQPRHRVRPGGAVRRGQAIRDRARRAATTGCWNSARRSTSPLSGDQPRIG